MSSKIGRNAPCPCGSGKKYKKCCLPGHAEAARQQKRTDHDQAPQRWFLEPDELDELTNSVPALIREGRLDEADAVCARLRDEYPDVVDGLDHQARVYEARGMNREAARYYREAAAFARAHEGFEEEGIQEWLDTADRLDPPPET